MFSLRNIRKTEISQPQGKTKKNKIGSSLRRAKAIRRRAIAFSNLGNGSDAKTISFEGGKSRIVDGNRKGRKPETGKKREPAEMKGGKTEGGKLSPLKMALEAANHHPAAIFGRGSGKRPQQIKK